MLYKCILLSKRYKLLIYIPGNITYPIERQTHSAHNDEYGVNCEHNINIGKEISNWFINIPL